MIAVLFFSGGILSIFFHFFHLFVFFVPHFFYPNPSSPPSVRLRGAIHSHPAQSRIRVTENYIYEYTWYARISFWIIPGMILQAAADQHEEREENEKILECSCSRKLHLYSRQEPPLPQF